MDNLFAELSCKELEEMGKALSSEIRRHLLNGNWVLIKPEERKLARIRRELALRRTPPHLRKRSFWSRLAWWRGSEPSGELSFPED